MISEIIQGRRVPGYPVVPEVPFQFQTQCPPLLFDRVMSMRPWPYARVGCQVHSVEHWREHWRSIAASHEVDVAAEQVVAVLALVPQEVARG